jgi:hypothetical protein
MGPSVIEWDQRGAANANLPCLCAETTRRGADILIAYQMKGLLIGAALGLISGLAFVVWRQRVKKAAAATTPPAT